MQNPWLSGSAPAFLPGSPHCTGCSRRTQQQGGCPHRPLLCQVGRGHIPQPLHHPHRASPSWGRAFSTIQPQSWLVSWPRIRALSGTFLLIAHTFLFSHGLQNAKFFFFFFSLCCQALARDLFTGPTKQGSQIVRLLC